MNKIYQKRPYYLDKMAGGGYKGIKHWQIVDFLLNDKLLEI